MAECPGGPDAKKPCKGILKSSSSFDKHAQSSNRKSAKFDEVNILQTFHPADKDYGHMKIEEPKTPYRVSSGEDAVDAELLAKKLEQVTAPDDDSGSSDEETEEQRKKRLEFERKRKAHYNEFEAVRKARELMKQDQDEEDDNADEADDAAEGASGGTDSSIQSSEKVMDKQENTDN